MSNRKELRAVRRKRDAAIDLARWVESLPRRRGSRVRWQNGVVWTRAGDDDWRPSTTPETSYHSEHVASAWWERIDPQSHGSTTTGEKR